MTLRKTILALSLVAAAAPAAFADNFVGGEAGWDTHAVSSPLPREQVQREYLAFRDRPVFADGTVMIQGEAGYVPAIQGASVDRTPSEPHTHALGNTGAPAVVVAPLTQAEQGAYRQQYIN